jgi:hypothetical protein
MYGSHVFLVVFTVMDPSIKFKSYLIPKKNYLPCSANDFLIFPLHSLIYYSLYFGNKVAKELSSIKGAIISFLIKIPPLLKGSIFHLSRVGSLSHGLSFLYLFFLEGY